MAIATAKSETSSFLQELYSMPGGEDLRLCIQCATCAGSCPNSNEMDYSPRQVLALVRAGMWEEVLRSNSMWFCVSCYLCTERCPRGIRLTDIMYALKSLAIRNSMTQKGGRTSTLSRLFVETVNKYGRNHEFELLTNFYLRTNVLGIFRMIPMGLRLLSQGRLPLWPHAIQRKGELRAIISKAQALGGV